MGKKIVCLITLISIILYYYAPYGDYWYFNVITTTLYIIEAIIVCQNEYKKKEYIGFNNLFSLSFFLTSFAFSILVQGTDAQIISEFSQKVIDYSYLPKCTSLCLFAYSIYALGYLNSIRNNDANLYAPRFTIKTSNSAKTLLLVLFIMLFYKTYSFLMAGGSINMDEDTFFASMFESALPLALIFGTCRMRSHSFLSFIKDNWLSFLLVAIILFMYTLIGDRGIIIICSLTILAVYTLLVNRISFKAISIMLVIGVLFMFFLRQTRGDINYLKNTRVNSVTAIIGQSNGAMYFLSDLTGAVDELCLGYEHKQKVGLYYPIENIILLPLNPIPLAPTLFTTIVFGKMPGDFETGPRLNKYTAYAGNGNFGNHVVIDIYMQWGILGIVLVFYLFGKLVGYLYSRRYDNIYCMVLYVVLVGLAVYTPRNTISYLIRPMSYAFFFTWYLLKLRNNKIIRNG